MTLPRPRQRVSPLRWRVAQAVETWWWRRYLGGRDPAAYSAWKRAYWARFLRQVGVSVRDGARVLDAGCGPAGVYTVLPQARVTALDPLLASYARLDHFAPTAYPYAQFSSTTLESFEGDDYDYVFCLNALNHVRDVSAALTVLAKAVRDDGTVVVSVDAHRHTPIQRIFEWIPGDVLHPHQLNLVEYVSAVEAAGLSVARRVVLKREVLFDYVALVCFRKTSY